ncbi:hypothetical protein ACFL6S_27105 [Candidatus Poribacteria bacterium]
MNRIFAIGLLSLVLISSVNLAFSQEEGFVIVKAKRKPDQPWKEYETRTIDLLPGFTPGAADTEFSKFGGWLDRKVEATGFFYVKKVGDRWWLVDPDGYLFIHVGVCSTRIGKSKTNKEMLEEKFGTPEQWAAATTDMLREYSFNGTGGWSDAEYIRKAPQPVVYTLMLSFMSSFGSKLRITTQLSGHKGYPRGCFPVFHPDFQEFCDERAKSLLETKDDPHLLGHFSDNELPMPSLEKHLELDQNNPDLKYGYLAAREWLTQRRGSEANAEDINDEDQDAWAEYVFDRYFEITTKATRKYDPNHLCLGPRFHGSVKKSRGAWKAAGKYLDVVAANYYGAWGPKQDWLSKWAEWSGKPMMITEFYTKGMDSGYPNNTGAGWIVETQNDRGLFYQHFVLGLLESGSCVGWHWFKYMDNDPSDLTTDPSNRDSNKGIITIKYDRYEPLLEKMKALNRDVYALIQYFDTNHR